MIQPETKEVNDIISTIEDVKEFNKDIIVMWDVESCLYAGFRESAIASELYPESIMLHRRMRQFCEKRDLTLQMGICSVAEIVDPEWERIDMSYLFYEGRVEKLPKSLIDKKKGAGVKVYNRENQNNGEDNEYYREYKEQIIFGIQRDPYVSEEYKKKLVSYLIEDGDEDPLYYSECGWGLLPKLNFLLLYILKHKYVDKNPKNIDIIYIDNDIDYLGKLGGKEDTLELAEKLGCKIQPIIVNSTRSINPKVKYQRTASATKVEDILFQLEEHMICPLSESEKMREKLKFDIELNELKIEIWNKVKVGDNLCYLDQNPDVLTELQKKIFDAKSNLEQSEKDRIKSDKNRPASLVVESHVSPGFNRSFSAPAG